MLEGVRAGLLLALLVGPLLVLLVQLSLRQGTLAALAAAVGIWLSDAGFVLLSHYGMGWAGGVLDYPYFAEIVGSVGALLLTGIAVATWFRRPVDLNEDRVVPTRGGLLRALLQGFAINTLNPFTIFFWSAFVITQVHDRELPEPAAWTIYAGILGTIVLTDTLKVLGARRLRELLTPKVTRRVQRLGAVALGVFGLVLCVRVWWDWG